MLNMENIFIERFKLINTLSIRVHRKYAKQKLTHFIASSVHNQLSEGG